MIGWLRKLERHYFSPPHSFQTIFSFVAARLSLNFEADAEVIVSDKSETASAAGQSDRDESSRLIIE